MNRREMITALTGATCLPAAEVGAAVIGNGPTQPPVIILHTQMRLTPDQARQRWKQAKLQANQCGCDVLFYHGVDGVEIANRKYGFRETIGNNSVSGFFDTADEMAQWFPRTSERIA